MELNTEEEVLSMAGTKITQCQEILKYMEREGSITSLDAIRDLGCTRLASRITDLKRKGHSIATTMETSKNRAGKSARYARYRLVELDE